MLTLRQMAEAHLGNVLREIQGLGEQMRQLDEQRKSLIAYLEEGKQALANDVPVMPDSRYSTVPPDSLLKVFGGDDSQNDDGN